jgi:NAD(P)-dependent dehydrogenase (short-subunit alcohol dehydrogenase family)
MQEFRGRVAVITGAASGLDFALAERAARLVSRALQFRP